MLPPMTIVPGASMIELWELPLKSMLTSSSHQFSRAGGGGYHVQGGGARPADILMDSIHDTLVIGIGMDGGHQPLGYTEGIVQYLDRRGDAVGGAGGVGDDVVFFGIILFFIDAEDNG